MWEPHQEIELRDRLHATPHLCVACDEIARSQQRTNTEGMKSAYSGGVYHVVSDEEPRGR